MGVRLPLPAIPYAFWQGNCLPLCDARPSRRPDRLGHTQKGGSVSERLTFIGPSEVSVFEATALTVLGQALAYQHIELTIAPRGAANDAILAGYREFKGTPTLKAGRVLGDPTDALLVYSDEDGELIKLMEQSMPGWRRHQPEPTIVQGEDELQDYVYALLAAITQKQMETMHVEGPDTTGSP